MNLVLWLIVAALLASALPVLYANFLDARAERRRRDYKSPTPLERLREDYVSGRLDLPEFEEQVWFALTGGILDLAGQFYYGSVVGGCGMTIATPRENV